MAINEQRPNLRGKRQKEQRTKTGKKTKKLKKTGEEFILGNPSLIESNSFAADFKSHPGRGSI